MYSFESRVRYSEVTKNKHMDITSIINYFQDCSTFQSEDLGIGISYLESRHRCWILNAWQIQFNRFPSLGEKITISTWPYAFKSMFGYRNFTIQDQDGAICAVANSTWVLMDSITQRPLRVTPDDMSDYHIEAPYPMEYVSRKILLPTELATLDSFPVVKSNIDTYNHVNNGQYINMAKEYLPIDFPLKQLRAEYRNSAHIGDTIVPKINSTDKTYTIVLANTENTPYAIIEFES